MECKTNNFDINDIDINCVCCKYILYYVFGSLFKYMYLNTCTSTPTTFKSHLSKTYFVVFR